MWQKNVSLNSAVIDLRPKMLSVRDGRTDDKTDRPETDKPTDGQSEL